jgi:hypothetical protein
LHTRAKRPSYGFYAFAAFAAAGAAAAAAAAAVLDHAAQLHRPVQHPALGLVLLTGVAGLTSFGQAAFVGVGAYTAAYLAPSWASPWLGCWPGSP